MQSEIHCFNNFYSDKNVFITGHTGFKGSWLSILLHAMGANVTGYAKPCKSQNDTFLLAGLSEKMHHVEGDVLDGENLKNHLAAAQPEVVFHLAAQPLVRYAYQNPEETYCTNVMGTLHVLEAVRQTPSVKALVVVTSDKCYANKEWCWGYRETDQLGGHDPYSTSKACAELLTASYRQCFFENSPTAIATVRAGNVIGGGDWSEDRIIPDCVRSFLKGEPVALRHPDAVRPWQHVLDPLFAYLHLAKRMAEQPETYAQAFNFGPDASSCVTVKEVVRLFMHEYGSGAMTIGNPAGPHEATFLSLDISKARSMLQWKPVWDIATTIKQTAQWYKNFNHQDVYLLCLEQIKAFMIDYNDMQHSF